VESNQKLAEDRKELKSIIFQKNFNVNHWFVLFRISCPHDPHELNLSSPLQEEMEDLDPYVHTQLVVMGGVPSMTGK